MILDVDFIQFLIKENSKEGIKIFVTDSQNTLIASTQLNNLEKYLNLSRYVLDNSKPILVENIDEENLFHCITAIPFILQNKIEGTLILEGEKETIVKVGNNLKNSLESVMLYNMYNKLNIIEDEKEKYRGLVDLLLDENFQEDKVLSLMNKFEIDSSLMFSVIYIDYTFEKANYFNININLGYQSEIINTKETIDECLKSIKYLNTQDIVARKGQNGSVIIKSYLPASDLNEVYLANQKICNEIDIKLKDIVPLEYYIASGDVYKDIKDVRKSFIEAKAILDIAKKYNKGDKVLTLKSILIEDTFNYLDSHIINRLIITNLNKIKEMDNDYDSFINLIETFVDCNFNIAKTSLLTNLHRNTIKNKLEKLKNFTELDPLNNFSDAFLIKMIAIFYKQSKK
ncbi:MAG: PucR family transcriptional regulator [Pleomorphochaeta sp.]